MFKFPSFSTELLQEKQLTICTVVFPRQLFEQVSYCVFCRLSGCYSLITDYRLSNWLRLSEAEFFSVSLSHSIEKQTFFQLRLHHLCGFHLSVCKWTLSILSTNQFCLVGKWLHGLSVLSLWYFTIHCVCRLTHSLISSRCALVYVSSWLWHVCPSHIAPLVVLTNIQHFCSCCDVVTL